LQGKDAKFGIYSHAGMLKLGDVWITDDKYPAHFRLRAMMTLPMIAGNDVANITTKTHHP
jgi:hypothetical protein